MTPHTGVGCVLILPHAGAVTFVEFAALSLADIESSSPPRPALTGQAAPAASAAFLPQALSKETAHLTAAGQKSEPVCAGVLGLCFNIYCLQEEEEAAPLAQLHSGPQNKDIILYS